MNNRTEFLPYAESVKMLREALKRNFPGVRFSVAKSCGRSSSVRVRYQFGPTAETVDRVAQRYHGTDFDGMTDLASPVTSILAGPDGSLREVRHGIRYIFVERDIPDEYVQAAVEALGSILSPDEWNRMQPWDRESMARRGYCKISASADESPADFGKRAAHAYCTGEVLSVGGVQ